MKIPGIKFNPTSKQNNGRIIQYQTQLSGCFDIFSDEHYVLAPMKRRLFHTGIYLDHECFSKYENSIYPDCVPILVIRPRSGIAANSGIQTLAGEIDADYKSEIRVLLINFGDEDFPVQPGDRIAQARWIASIRPPSVKVSDSERRGGFSSTGL